MTMQYLDFNNNCNLKFKAVDVIQENNKNAPAILALPKEILIKIAEFIGTPDDNSNCDNSDKVTQSAKNYIRFGRVCVWTHLITHKGETNKLILALLRKYTVFSFSYNPLIKNPSKNDPLLKLAVPGDPFREHYIGSDGKLIYTIKMPY
jgi:hypothetical protein